ncbi:hypothetical protein QO010_002433 [Caulobacter ginsengisoli]|uniref:DUF4349 domain-containing protein n=1 Tax=Caulobacter ginsengisoli TaxID=400775 RepID=A0ABU0IRL0_9CAUL|nr:DUF4349 domain-containing protein [Caulobacter ginsengisoli]MDQ0464649.1 hypothetical protein [Caulobacter ginsengisoli]
MRKAFILMAVLVLTACSRPAERSAVFSDEKLDAAAPAADAAAAPVMMLKPPPANARGGAEPAPAPVPISTPQLAYSYSYGISASPKGVRGLLAAHQAACAAAGLNRCQVVSSTVNEMGEDRVRATLSFRATPDWLKTFRAGIEGQARDAGGKVNRADVTSEDLSRQLVDTEAALRAKTTLRDRLQNLLATRPGKLSDLVELEQALSNVQGEIDTTTSELAMMRARVAMSDVTIGYESGGVLAPQGVMSPLTDAIGDFVGILAGTIGLMIRFIAVAAPWVLLVGGLIWLFRKRLPKFRRKPATPES